MRWFLISTLLLTSFMLYASDERTSNLDSQRFEINIDSNLLKIEIRYQPNDSNYFISDSLIIFPQTNVDTVIYEDQIWVRKISFRLDYVDICQTDSSLLSFRFIIKKFEILSKHYTYPTNDKIIHREIILPYTYFEVKPIDPKSSRK